MVMIKIGKAELKLLSEYLNIGVLIKKISLWTITENSFGFSPMENY